MPALLNPSFVPGDRCLKAHKWSLVFGLLLIGLPFISFSNGTVGPIKFEIAPENAWVIDAAIFLLFLYNSVLFFTTYTVEALAFRDKDLIETRDSLVSLTKKDVPENLKELHSTIEQNRNKNQRTMFLAGYIRTYFTFFSPIFVAIAAACWHFRFHEILLKIC